MTKRTRGRTSSIQGFSLLEALVAMVIASVALGVLYRTVGQSSKNAMDIQARVEAAFVARSVLAAATFAEDLTQQSNGQTGPWHWSIQVLAEQAPLTEADRRPTGATLPVAKVTIEVMREDSASPVLTWTSWKPYRATP